MMDVPLVIIEEIYNLLCLHDEPPKMGKELFVDWYSRGQNTYKYVAECKTVNFHCKAPFSCYVTGGSKCEELNKILLDMSIRFTKILAFW